MSHVMDSLLVFSIIYMIIWGAITATVNTAFADAWDGVTCPFPDYYNGYDESCSTVSHPDPYDDDQFVLWNVTEAWYTGGQGWLAGIPTGWANYFADTLGVLGTKGGAFIDAILAIFVVPELTMYGQTVDASQLGWLAGGLFAFAIFGLINQFKGWL